MSAAEEEKPRRRRPELPTLAVVLLLTGVHLGYRTVHAPDGPAAVRVSTLPAGVVVPGAVVLGAPEQSTCRIVISFSPDCPFCKRAAEREKSADRSGAYASSTWVTDEPRESLAPFNANLPEGATSRLDPALYRSLRVRAVPGLYLFDRDARLRWVGPYRGDEDSELLENRCTMSSTDPTG